MLLNISRNDVENINTNVMIGANEDVQLQDGPYFRSDVSKGGMLSLRSPLARPKKARPQDPSRLREDK